MTIDQFKEMLGTMGVIRDSIKKAFADESIPVDDRWAMFKLNSKAEAYVNVKSWYMDFDVLDDDFLPSRDLERHRTIDLVTLVEWCTDAYLSPGDKYLLSEDDLRRLKEEILHSGYTAFVFDW